MMAAAAWIIPLLCAAGALLSSASPVLRSALVVPPGQNASLSCNKTLCSHLTWYLLRSDQLLPLGTVTQNKIGRDSVNYHTDNRRLKIKGSLEKGEVVLEIQQVEEEDSGVYFCSWQCEGNVSVSRRIHLSVQGAKKESAGLPCWSLGICVLPALLVSVVTFIVALFIYSGKPAGCSCCRSNNNPKNTEDPSLHYSSLKHADQFQPPSRGRGGGGGGSRLVKEEVMYSTVAGCKKLQGSHGR